MIRLLGLEPLLAGEPTQIQVLKLHHLGKTLTTIRPGQAVELEQLTVDHFSGSLAVVGWRGGVQERCLAWVG